MSNPVENRQAVLVLAGIAPGLGLAVAETFAAAGYRVAGISRGREFGHRLQSEFNRAGWRYRHYVSDVTQLEKIEAVLGAIESDSGPPNVLVYNPMQLLIKPFLELSAQDFESVWRVICLGAMIMARSMLPSMLKAGSGTMIFSGATASTKGSARFSSLASAKFALRGLVQSLAREFGPQGVHVVHAILDGLIWAPQTRARFDPARKTCIEPGAVAQTYLQLVNQHQSAWTHEMDLRPALEQF